MHSLDSQISIEDVSIINTRHWEVKTFEMRRDRSCEGHVQEDMLFLMCVGSE